ncbi:hypothetical protein KKI43_20025 [Arthrobacter sp. GN70]|nr:hypothetical protein [Arthrobacter sp. GN70]
MRNDVLYACKLEGEYTTLVNAANAGFLRLFCTTHVIEEVAEHREEWCRQKGIDAAQFEALWVEQYLPLLRLVSEVSGDLLSDDERHRIGRLREVDPDDVPSATLALVIGAFYLSQDRPATTAVYGEARGLKELEQWRSALAAGGNAGAIYWTLDAGIMTARLIRMGLSGLFSTVRALPSWAQAVVAGATAASAIYAWKRVDAERTQRLRDAMERIFRLVAAVGGVHQDAAARLESVSAPMPTMRILAEDRSPSEVLTRSVLYQLARSSKGVQSAAELARALPTLPVAQGEGKAREVLRSQAYARQVFRGRWQLGEPVTWPPGQQHTP